MNENIDLTKILDGCPKGTEFYHAGYGRVWFVGIDLHSDHPIRLSTAGAAACDCVVDVSATVKGTLTIFHDGECLLYPSKEQRDWSKFKRFWDNPKENYDKGYEPDIMYKETYAAKGMTTVERAAEVFSEMLIELWPVLLDYRGIAKKWENEFRKRLEE